jgi:hypothetical protein
MSEENIASISSVEGKKYSLVVGIFLGTETFLKISNNITNEIILNKK